MLVDWGVVVGNLLVVSFFVDVCVSDSVVKIDWK
jgi:hypothetical protein